MEKAKRHLNLIFKYPAEAMNEACHERRDFVPHVNKTTAGQIANIKFLKYLRVIDGCLGWLVYFSGP